MAYSYYVYIMASYKNGTLYTGVTNDLYERIRQHKDYHNPNSFTAKNKVTRLVYYEVFEDIYDAIKREKAIKKQSRAYRVRLIQKDNPDWSELFHRLEL